MKKNRSGIILVIICSFLGTIAQMLFKLASNQSLSYGLEKFIINPYLFLGYIAYGLSTLLLTIALRKGALSVLYPFIALTFVWVSILSPILFRSDSLNGIKFLGVSSIVIGVSFIGFGNSNEN